MEQAELNTTDHAASASALKVAIVVGSTRPGRKADAVARWVQDIAVGRDDATFEVVDVADYALPHLDEPMPPMAGQYSQSHTREWAAKIGSFDAYVFVTPEHNHSTSGALKNAIDSSSPSGTTRPPGSSATAPAAAFAPSSTCAWSWANSDRRRPDVGTDDVTAPAPATDEGS